MINLFKKLIKCNRGCDDNNHHHQHQTPPPHPQPPQQPSFNPSEPAQHSPAYSTTEPPLAYRNPYHQPLQQGGVMNSGGNSNGSAGAQKQGDGKEDNEKKKSGGVVIGSIGGNHGHHNGISVTGHTTVGNIG